MTYGGGHACDLNIYEKSFIDLNFQLSNNVLKDGCGRSFFGCLFNNNLL